MSSRYSRQSRDTDQLLLDVRPHPRSEIRGRGEVYPRADQALQILDEVHVTEKGDRALELHEQVHVTVGPRLVSRVGAEERERADAEPLTQLRHVTFQEFEHIRASHAGHLRYVRLR